MSSTYEQQTLTAGYRGGFAFFPSLSALVSDIEQDLLV